MRGSRLQICGDLVQEVIRLRLRPESHKVKLPFLGREVSQRRNSAGRLPWKGCPIYEIVQ